MSKTFIGNVAAYVKEPGKEKASYPRIGSAFRDEHNRISFKIDTLPHAGMAWTGWCNVFPATDEKPRNPGTAAGQDDEPF